VWKYTDEGISRLADEIWLRANHHPRALLIQQLSLRQSQRVVQLVSQPFCFLLGQPDHRRLGGHTDTLEIVCLGDLVIVKQVLHDEQVHILLCPALSVVREDCVSAMSKSQLLDSPEKKPTILTKEVALLYVDWANLKYSGASSSIAFLYRQYESMCLDVRITSNPPSYELLDNKSLILGHEEGRFTLSTTSIPILHMTQTINHRLFDSTSATKRIESLSIVDGTDDLESLAQGIGKNEMW
jgi:hypothetical protein